VDATTCTFHKGFYCIEMDSEAAASAGKKRVRSKSKSKAASTAAHNSDNEEDVETSPENKTVYLEGLPYDASVDDIRAFFEGTGEITDIRAPVYNDSGRLRGYAHVDFSSSRAASKALELDGQYIGKRFVSISMAKPVGAGGATTMPISNRPRPHGCTTLFVKGLPYDSSEDDISAVFKAFGNVLSVRIARWNHTDRQKGFGLLVYQT
jgi:nucleolin